MTVAESTVYIIIKQLFSDEDFVLIIKAFYHSKLRGHFTLEISWISRCYESSDKISILWINMKKDLHCFSDEPQRQYKFRWVIVYCYIYILKFL